MTLDQWNIYSISNQIDSTYSFLSVEKLFRFISQSKFGEECNTIELKVLFECVFFGQKKHTEKKHKPTNPSSFMRSRQEIQQTGVTTFWESHQLISAYCEKVPTVTDRDIGILLDYLLYQDIGVTHEQHKHLVLTILFLVLNFNPMAHFEKSFYLLNTLLQCQHDQEQALSELLFQFYDYNVEPYLLHVYMNYQHSPDVFDFLNALTTPQTYLQLYVLLNRFEGEFFSGIVSFLSAVHGDLLTTYLRSFIPFLCKLTTLAQSRRNLTIFGSRRRMEGLIGVVYDALGNDEFFDIEDARELLTQVLVILKSGNFRHSFLKSLNKTIFTEPILAGCMTGNYMNFANCYMSLFSID